MRISTKSLLSLLAVLVLLAASVNRASAAPVIASDTNPVVVPAGQTAGSALINWDAENYKNAEVWLKESGGEESKFSSESKGTKSFSLKVGPKYIFRLYDKKPFLGPIKNPLVKVLASLELSALNPVSSAAPTSTVLPTILPATLIAPLPPPAPGSTPAYIYTLRSDGTLSWLRHDGAASGVAANVSGSWQGPRVVDEDWDNFKEVFAGDNGDIYAVVSDGVLRLYKHSGFQTGVSQDEAGGWLPPQSLSKGWSNFKQAFSGGGGVLYALANDGTLKWYKHGTAGGKATWEGPKDVATNWGSYRKAFAGGRGIIYVLTFNGKLLWFKHLGFATGASTWDGPKEVGSGWGDFEHVFCAGDGLFYAVKTDGKLMWYRQYGHDAGFKNWMPEKVVGGGWNGLKQVFALLSPRPVAVPPGPGTPPTPPGPTGGIGDTAVEKSGGVGAVSVTETRAALAALPFISALRVVPDTRDVMISFESTQSAKPLIEISKVAPKSDGSGVLAFPFDSGAFSRFISGVGGKYNVNLDDLGAPLDVGTTYYYIITVFNDDKTAKKQREQATGQFTTLPQTVKVTWHKIYLTDDSDDLSDGECDFWFWANYGQPGGKVETYSKKGFGSGHFNYPDKVVVLENASDTLTLSASGKDDDNIGTTLFVPGGPPLTGPKSNDKEDSNVANGTFDLTRYPGNNVTVPFTLSSMPGGKLKFVVYGQFEITRPRP
jgi:hypothetical protein